MKAEYKILEARRLSDDLVLGYLNVDFSFTDRPALNVYLSVLVHDDLIAHYQVSRLPSRRPNRNVAVRKVDLRTWTLIWRPR